MRSQMLKVLLTVVLLVFAIGYNPAGSSAATYGLSMDTTKWEEELANIGSTSPSEAATFLISGDQLHIGPWRAGEYAARYVYKQAFNFVSGTVQGQYYTENAIQGQAQVAVYFQDINGNTLYKDKFHLAAQEEWTNFSFPIRRAPAGSVKVVVAFGNSFKNDGIIHYQNLQVTDTPWSISFPTAPPTLTRASKPNNFSIASKWRLEESNGTWWFVKPNGEPFYSLGLDTPYVNNSIGSQAIDIQRSLNFNTMGGWSDIVNLAPINDQKSEPFPAMTTIENGTLKGTFDRVVSAFGEAPDGHTMPDPFDPRWKTVLKAKITTYKNSTDDKPWFIGYFTDNEINHTDLHRKVYSPNASQAFKAWLSAKYNSNISQLNTAWNTSYASFDALIAAKPDPAKRSGVIFEDFYAFKRVMVQQYVDVVKSSFMEVYNNNPPLLFSNRFTVDLSDVYDVLDIYTEAFDGIGYNMYPGGLQIGLPKFVINQLEELHQLTNKPIIISEWSLPALDSGLYNNPAKLDFSYPENVDTQTERARQAAYISAQFYNIPYIVGSHWFIWYDFDDSDRSANRGIFKADGWTPWTELKTALTSVNEAILAGGGNVPNPDPSPTPTPGGSTTVTLHPVADAYVRGGALYKNVNYGSDSILNVKDSSSEQYDRISYLKFDLSDISATNSTNAVLKVYVRNLPNGKPVTLKAVGITDDSWTENGIKWSNKPALGTPLVSVSVTSTGMVYSFDITSFVSSQLTDDQIVSIALHDDGQQDKEVQMDSKEGPIKPVLEVTY